LSKQLAQEKESVCEQVDHVLLTSRALPTTLIDPEQSLIDLKAPPAAPPADLDRAVVKFIKHDPLLSKNDDLQHSISAAALSYKTFWDDDSAKGFNLTLLQALHPECFYTAGAAYRWIVTAGDQVFRRDILLFALVVSLIGFAVDMNRTSLHRFYRNRLRHAYLAPPKTDTTTALQLSGEVGNDISLSELKTTEYGAPYHIINATLELSRPRFLDEVDAESLTPDTERRDRQTFIFSQRFCGSKATGWKSTQKYQDFLKENISLADAMALSGAAADPLRSDSLPVALLMTTLNLTLGQWMPNTAMPKPHSWQRARAFSLLRDWFKPVDESRYCFVSDGGFTDNLGVLTLLKRRCRVIIAVDASCDPQQQFADLGVVLRAARIQDGIKVLQPNGLEQSVNTRTFELDKKRNCKEHVFVAKIVYPEAGSPPGWLVYLKPSFTGDEGTDLLDYRLEEPDFPHDTTVDQFYDATRFENYRQLGHHMAMSLHKQLTTKQRNGLPLEARLDDLATSLVQVADAPSIESSMQVTATSVAHASNRLQEIVGALQATNLNHPATLASVDSAVELLKECVGGIEKQLSALESRAAKTADAQHELVALLQSIEFNGPVTANKAAVGSIGSDVSSTSPNQARQP
jgi:hypothetical protein